MSDAVRRNPREERQLSSAARAALDEYLEDMRARIILDARLRVGPGKISASDIVDAFAGVSDTSSASSRQTSSRRFRLTILYAALGGLTGFTAVLLALYGASRDTVTLLVAATSLAFAITVAFLTFILQLRGGPPGSRGSVTTPAFMDLWIDTELLVRQLATRNLGSSTNELPFTRLVALLRHTEVINGEQELDLYSALKVRNSLVHGRRADPEVVQKAAEALSNFGKEFRRTRRPTL